MLAFDWYKSAGVLECWIQTNNYWLSKLFLQNFIQYQALILNRPTVGKWVCLYSFAPLSVKYLGWSFMVRNPARKLKTNSTFLEDNIKKTLNLMFITREIWCLY